ncbi:MAG TPA: T6SS immunity protein Tdi1 domain-containing protein, partial [Bacteroidia bacterium]
LVITKMGDLVLRNKEGHLYFLDTVEGTLTHVSNYYSDFYKNKLNPKQYLDIFKPELIEDMIEDGKELDEEQVYAYKTLPVLGGKEHPSNMYPADIYKHFMATAYVHEQLDTIDPPIGSEDEM